MRVILLCVAVALLARGADASLDLTHCTGETCNVGEALPDPHPEFGFSVTGTIAVNATALCASRNGGEVALALYVAGETYSGTAALWQQDGCGADGVTPVWTVSASLDLDIVVNGITLQGVSIEAVHETAWAGTVSGTASSLFGGAGAEGAVLLAADFSAETGLTALRGDVTLAGDGVSFSGTVATDGTTSTGDGALLVGGSVAAQASFTYTHATKAFAVLGSVQGALEVGTVTLSSAGVTLAKADGGAWSGSVSGTAALFGGTAAASMAFADGKLAALAVSTTFVTGNGLLSGSLAFDYVRADTCATSTGTFGGVLKMSGAAELAFDGTVAFDGCTGVVSVAASVDGEWAAPGGVSVAGVTVQATSSGFADGGASTALSAQTWVGSVSGTTGGADVAVAFDVAFDTSSDASSVEAMLSYADTNLIVQVMVNTNCSGSGLVQVQNLAPGVPALEVAVEYTRESCGGASKAWALEGSLGDSLLIDFSGKTLSLAPAVVRVVSNEVGALHVEIVAGLAPFEVVAAFGAGDAGEVFTLTARTMEGAVATPGAFLAAMSGGVGSVFGSGAGAAFSSLFSGMNELTLTDLLVVFDFVKPSISLTATGTLFGAGFDVLVVVEKASSAWKYALALTTTGLSDLSFPGLAGSVVETLAPEMLMVSVASAATSFAGKDVPKGFSLAAKIPLDGAVMAGIAAVAPPSLNDQTADASGADGGVTIVASLASATEMRLALALAGGVELGSPDVILREVSLLLVVKAAGAPEFGFQVVIDVAMDDRVLSASAALLVDVAGLSLAVAFDSNEPWNKPFGMNGVAILFPLGLSISITPVGILSEFALTGGVQLSAAQGYVTLSVSLSEPTKNAFQAEVTTLDVQDVLVGLLDCTACTKGVGSVLTDMSVDHFKGSFNADPVNAVSITFADVSVEIPAGVSIELTNLDLWGVVKVKHASFALNADGMSAAFEAEVVEWGPLSITAATSNTRGPRFEMVLQASEQSLLIDGKASVFGQSVSLYLQMSDSAVEGHFALSLGSLKAAVTMSSYGRPGEAGFSNSVRAELEADLIGDIVRGATSYLLGLADDAKKELQDAKKAVESAEKAWDNAIAELNNVKEDVAADIKDAENELGRAKREVDKFDCGDIWLISDACEAGKSLVKGALSAAQATLAGVRKAATALISLAEDIVEESKILLDFAEEVLSFAEGAVGVFADVVDAIGSVLENMLVVHSLVFTSDLSNYDVAVSFHADVTIFGTRHRNLGFSVRINFGDIVDYLMQQLSFSFHSDFDGDLVTEKPGAPTAVASTPNTIEGQVGLVLNASYEAYVLTKYEIPAEERACAKALAGCDELTASGTSFWASIMKVRKTMCYAVITARCEEAKDGLGRDLWVQESLTKSGQRGMSTRLRGLAATVIAIEEAEVACKQKQAVLAKVSSQSIFSFKFAVCSLDTLRLVRNVMLDTLESESKAILTHMMASAKNATSYAVKHAAAMTSYAATQVSCSTGSIASCFKVPAMGVTVAVYAMLKETSGVQHDAVDAPLFDALAQASSSSAAGEMLFVETMKGVVTTWYTQLQTSIAALDKAATGSQCNSMWGKISCNIAAAQAAAHKTTLAGLEPYRTLLLPYF